MNAPSWPSCCTKWHAALRAEVASVNSLASVRKESELECSQPRPHVVPIGVDQQECNFDHKRFCNAEALVRYAVNRAMLIPSGEWSENDNSVRSSAINMERPDASAFIASKRKVSDASDDSELKHDSYSDFSPCVVSLVRSNIMLLKTSPLGSKLVRLTPQWGMAFNPTVPTNSEETEHILYHCQKQEALARVFSGLCFEYGERALHPLQLRTLRLGRPFSFPDLPTLSILTELKHLEDIYIFNQYGYQMLA